MTPVVIKFPQLHDKQREVAEHPARFRVMSAGRRWGKSRLGSALCISEGIDGRRAWWVAPSYPVATVGWRMIKRLAMQIPYTEIRQSTLSILFSNGGEVRVRSADNPDSLRGEGLDFVVLDECAYIQQDAWTHALRPALSDRQGRAMFISTPAGRNWFWHLWQRGLSGTDGEWHSWQLPTSDNPHINPAEIEAARHTLPERIFRQEYEAQFLEEGGGVFRRVVDAATAVPQASGDRKRQYVIGVDWAQSVDFTVLMVLDVAERMVVHMDRFNQIDYTVQRGRLMALAERFRPSAIIAEENSIGRPIIEQLQRDGLPVIPFTTTNATKTAAIDALALAFEQGNIRIPNDPVLIGELQAYEMSATATGLRRFSAPEGMHDDTVMALALAWTGIGVGHLPAAMTQDSLWTSKASKALPPARPGRWRKY